MREVVKRRGSFTATLPNLGPFAEREDAEEFARRFIESNPNEIERGLEAIEVRRVLARHA